MWHHARRGLRRFEFEDTRVQILVGLLERREALIARDECFFQDVNNGRREGVDIYFHGLQEYATFVWSTAFARAIFQEMNRSTRRPLSPSCQSDTITEAAVIGLVAVVFISTVA
jgi:hypothetical protein